MTNEQRVKAAAELIRSYDRLHNIKDELRKYDIPALQKSAAVGHDKETRIKVAALVCQQEIEKQAFMKALGSLGKGLYNAGSTFAKGVGNAASEAMIPLKQGYRQAKHNVMAPINTAGAAIKGFGQGLATGATNMGRGIYNAVGDVGQGLSNASNSLYKGFAGQPATKQAFSYAGVPGMVRNAQKLMNNPGLSAGTNALGKAVGAGAAGAGLGGLLGSGAAGAGRNLMQQVPGIAKSVARNAATGLGAGTNAFGRQALGGLGDLLGAGAGAGAAGLAAGGALGSRLGQQIGRLGQQLPGLGGFSPSGINPNAPTPRINLPSQSMPMPKPQPPSPMETLRRSGLQENIPLPARNAPLPAPRGFGYGVTNNPSAAGLGQ